VSARVQSTRPSRPSRPLPLAPPDLERRLAEHSAAMAACRRCAHPDHVLPIISEARAPRVMLVGQAPGQSEIADRRPFAGRAGKTLFRWLARAGMDESSFRSSVYIAAITRCYPGPSPSGRGDRVPSPAERASCAGWLENELRIIRPRLIIPVGRLAIDRFLGPLPLDSVVGRDHRIAVDIEGEVPLETTAIPLPHPSGASSWIHAPGHGELLEEALRLLGRRLRAVGHQRARGRGPKAA
jgi:uracil-DNA glycosylase